MERILLTAAIFAFFVLCALGMWWGWRNRARRQAAVLPAFPQPPAGPAADRLPPATGVYVGTTTAGDWQDRIAVGDIGHRATATLRLTATGLLVEREGASPLWVPVTALRGARTDRALAGKVMGTDGLLVVTWQLGDHLLDTGFRGDDKTTYSEWVSAVQALAPASGEDTR
ncbi:transporter [Longimycelium tulufanense]|uniref:Transporter n=1 Tax=Longimycelium tulufanense TaxID=907463 RepID=A0A8J3CBT3_9PSEU|nr:transporter [Longimycelium tulufanense]GGM71102.1 transporter [Longimycelium tulufanense]